MVIPSQNTVGFFFSTHTVCFQMVVIHPCIQYNKSVAVLLSTVCFQLLCDEVHVPFNSVQYTGSSSGLPVLNNPLYAICSWTAGIRLECSTSWFCSSCIIILLLNNCSCFTRSLIYLPQSHVTLLSKCFGLFFLYLLNWRVE